MRSVAEEVPFSHRLGAQLRERDRTVSASPRFVLVHRKPSNESKRHRIAPLSRTDVTQRTRRKQTERKKNSDAVRNFGRWIDGGARQRQLNALWLCVQLELMSLLPRSRPPQMSMRDCTRHYPRLQNNVDITSAMFPPFSDFWKFRELFKVLVMLGQFYSSKKLVSVLIYGALIVRTNQYPLWSNYRELEIKLIIFQCIQKPIFKKKTA